MVRQAPGAARRPRRVSALVPGAAPDLGRGRRHAASAVRAGALGLPMALAIIGGMPERFVPLVEVYREAARRAGHDAARLPLGINSHGYVAETSQQAADEFFPSYAAMMNAIGRERGWPPLARGDFDADARAARRAVRRQPAGGDRQDPLPARDLRAPAVPDADERRDAPARKRDASDRAAGNRGGPARCGRRRARPRRRREPPSPEPPRGKADGCHVEKDYHGESGIVGEARGQAGQGKRRPGLLNSGLALVEQEPATNGVVRDQDRTAARSASSMRSRTMQDEGRT